MRTRRCPGLWAFLTFLSCVPAHAAVITPAADPGPTHGDPFETFLNVLSNSPVFPGIDIRDMFGGEFSAGQPGRVTFLSPGTSDVQFAIGTDQVIYGYRLYLRGGAVLATSPVSDVKLAVDTTGQGFSTISNVHILNPGQDYVDVYGSDIIVVTETFANPIIPSPVLGTGFDLTLTSTATFPGDPGPTVIEFDALVPEPAGLAAAASVLCVVLSQRARRRRRPTDC